MSRTAPVATPGTTPTDSTALSLTAGLETNTEDLKQDSADAGPSPFVPEEETTEDKLDRQQRELDDLRALIHQMGKNQAGASAEAVKLPTMKAVQHQKPSIPVLTEDGWYVPAVHPTDRLVKIA